MAITFDAAANTNGGSTNPITWNHTCSGNNRCLIVAIGTNGGNPLEVTYAGNAMTNVGIRQENATGYRVSLWRLVAPTTGTNQVRVSLSTGAAHSCRSLSFTDVHQTSPNGTFVGATASAATAASMSVSSTAGEVVVDAIVWNQNASPSSASAGAQQTLRGGAGAGSFVRCAMSTESGSATVTMSWGLTSATNVTYCGVPLKPASVNTAIAWASVATTANSTAGTALTINKPSNVVDGDLMLAMVGWTGNIAVINAAPVGWTSILTTSAGAAADADASGVSLASYYRVASAEGTAYTWSFSGASVSNAGSIWRITGQHSSAPFDAATGNTGQGAQADAAAATTNYNDELINFLCAYNSGETGFSFTPPSGYVNHTDVQTAGNARLLGVEKKQAGAGTTGAPFALGNNAIASDWWAVQIVTFRPPTGAVDARQEGIDSIPTNPSLYHQIPQPRGFCGWMNKDASPDELIAAGPFGWTEMPPFFRLPPQPRRGVQAGPMLSAAATPSPPPSAVASQSIGPRISLPPPTLTDKLQWQRQAAAWMAEANKGHLQNTGIITLSANSNSTVVVDERAGANSYIDFMPRTANAALEKSGGTLYVSSQGKQTFTITHSNNAQTDRTFIYTILG